MYFWQVAPLESLPQVEAGSGEEDVWQVESLVSLWQLAPLESLPQVESLGGVLQIAIRNRQDRVPVVAEKQRDMAQT